MTSNSVIIVAGGSGSRMKQSLPKQFITIYDKPLLVYTIEAFFAFDPGISVVLVLPEPHMGIWAEISAAHFPEKFIETVIGGKTRYQSVANGLVKIKDGLVAIHDAVRPCIAPEIISKSFESAARHGSGIVTVPLKDSIRHVDGGESIALDRSRYQIVQTPQTFQVSKIKEAFEAGEQPNFTDDASVFETVLGEQVNLVAGDYRNIKVTTPEDLEVVSVLLKK